jgi:hypothetical protein
MGRQWARERAVAGGADRRRRAATASATVHAGRGGRKAGGGRGQAAAFEDAGWDVTDNKRRPLRMLTHWSLPLWLAVRGVAGTLPFTPDEPESDTWGGGMAEAARRFRKERR